MSGFDLADPKRGIFATYDPARGAAIFDQEQVLAAGAAEPAPDGATANGRATVAVGEHRLELELAALGPAARLGGELIPAQEISLCRVLGLLRGPGREDEIACLGVGVRDLDGTPAEAGLRRTIAIAFADGSLLAVAAGRPAGSSAHGEEEVQAVRVEPGGEEHRFSEALLSTEYDESGRHRRATLELWSETEGPAQPVRGAGTLVCGTTLDGGGGRAETAFFRWSVDGRPGFGRYEVVTV